MAIYIQNFDTDWKRAWKTIVMNIKHQCSLFPSSLHSSLFFVLANSKSWIALMTVAFNKHYEGSIQVWMNL